MGGRGRCCGFEHHRCPYRTSPSQVGWRYCANRNGEGYGLSDGGRVSRHGAQRLHAVKVATVATAVVAVAAVILAVVLNLVEVHRLVQGVDSRLSERLADVVKPDVGPGPLGESGSIPSLQHDADFSDAPSFVWQ